MYYVLIRIILNLTKWFKEQPNSILCSSVTESLASSILSPYKLIW